jgi:diacylglycerol kinase (ATP)
MASQKDINMKAQPFSIRSRIRSFRYAWEGIATFLQKEHNARLHLMATVVVVTLAILVPVTKAELLALVLAIGMVWVTEIFNTCIEQIMDFVSPQRHPDVKFIKDLAAGGVLVASIAAVVIGIIVFIPKLFGV